MNRSVIIIFLIFLFSNCAFSQLNGPNRAQTISNIFQIPIQTLTAISNVAQNTRPIGQIISQRRRPQQSQSSFPQSNFQQSSFLQSSFSQSSFPSRPSFSGNFQQQQQRPAFDSFGNYISRAARIAGLYLAPDGSGFRI